MNLILIELSNICNLHCPGCATATGTRPKGRMPLERFTRTLRLINGHQKTRVALHGYGEPTINPDLFEYLAALDEQGFSNVDFSTNGLELDRVCDRLPDFRCLSWVRVSLNSSRKTMHEELNAGSDFDRVVRNARRLVALKPPFRVVIQHLVSPRTKEEKQADFRKLIPGEWKYLRKRMHNYAGQTPIRNVKGKRQKCPNGRYGGNLIIQWDGDIVGCCTDNTKTQVVGNVDDGLFQEYRRRLGKACNRGDFTDLPLCRRCLR